MKFVRGGTVGEASDGDVAEETGQRRQIEEICSREVGETVAHGALIGEFAGGEVGGMGLWEMSLGSSAGGCLL